METKKEILKVEVSSKRIIVHYSEVINGIVNNYTVENSLKNKGIHPDLPKAMSVLDGYLSEIFYLTPSEKLVKVNYVELGGNVENNYIILGGQLALASKNLTKIKSDKIKVDVDECPYGFKEDLKTDVGVLMNEVSLYCFEGKQSQLELPFEKEDGNEGKEINFEHPSDESLLKTGQVGFSEALPKVKATKRVIVRGEEVTQPVVAEVEVETETQTDLF